MKRSILVVDDEYGIREFLYELFKDEYEVSLAQDGQEAIDRLNKEIYDVALIDLRMPIVSGTGVLEHIKTNSIRTIPIVITADRDMEHAISSMKQGAYDYITKPIDHEKLKIVVKNALDKKGLEDKVDNLRKELIPNLTFPNIIGQSKPMRKVFSTMENVINNDATVLIYGESGTGKEVIARAIHYNGARKNENFIPVDCASIPSSLIETELFGYEKGAFTGAGKSMRGKFEIADNGTLFLDEISNIPMEAQAKLLRVIQEKEFLRVGGEKKISVDTRIISASNKDLRLLIAKGLFREDLFYRLNVIPIVLPPLRDRREDIPLLMDKFLEQYTKEYKKDISVTTRALHTMVDYSWPGNVRELKNFLNRMVLITEGNMIDYEHLPSEVRMEKNSKEKEEDLLSSDITLEKLEKVHIRNLLKKYDYNITIVSDILGVTRKTLYSKIKKYELGR